MYNIHIGIWRFRIIQYILNGCCMYYILKNYETLKCILLFTSYVGSFAKVFLNTYMSIIVWSLLGYYIYKYTYIEKESLAAVIFSLRLHTRRIVRIPPTSKFWNSIGIKCKTSVVSRILYKMPVAFSAGNFIIYIFYYI